MICCSLPCAGAASECTHSKKRWSSFREVDGTCVHAKLGACAGVGIKGGVAASVGVLTVAEFALWYKHQVSNSLDRNIGYFIDDPDFKKFCMIHALAIVTGESLPVVYGRAAYQAVTHEELQQRVLDYVRSNAVEVARRIKEAEDVLLVSLAETKGFLLRVLEDIQGRADAIWQAVERLFSAAQTHQEVLNIYQFANIDIGEKTSGGRELAARLVGEPALARVERAVRSRPAAGHHLALNDSFKYALQSGTHLAWSNRGSPGPYA